MRETEISIPIYKEIYALEKFIDLLKITQLINGKAGTQM